MNGWFEPGTFESTRMMSSDGDQTIPTIERVDGSPIRCRGFPSRSTTLMTVPSGASAIGVRNDPMPGAGVGVGGGTMSGVPTAM